MSEANKPTTPEEVLSAIGELIVYKTEQGYNTDEMVALVTVYDKLLDTVLKIKKKEW